MSAAGVLPRARPACLTTARGLSNRVGSPVSARVGRADRGQPVDGGDQPGQAELVEHVDHARLDVGESPRRVLPVGEYQRCPLQGAGRCAVTPAGSASASKPRRRSAGTAAAPPRGSRGGLRRSNRAARAAAAGQVAAVPGPGPPPSPRTRSGPERLPRTAARRARRTRAGRASAGLAARVGDQLLAAGTQMPQPAPGLVEWLGHVAAQLRGQPGDHHRVLLVGLVEGQVLGLAGPRHQQRLHAHERHPAAARPAGPAPATGARSARTPPSPGEPRRPGSPAPSPAPHPAPRPGTGTSPGQHLRVVIGHHDHLLAIGQVDPDDRVAWQQLAQPASLALRLRSPRDTPLPLPMNVLLPAMGHQARQAHQEDVPASITDAFKELEWSSPGR